MHPRIFTSILIIVAFLILAFLGIKNAKGDITDILLMDERPTSGIIFYQRDSQPAQSLIYFRNQNIITIYETGSKGRSLRRGSSSIFLFDELQDW